MKSCIYCSEEIQDRAKKCRYCGEWFDESETKPEPESKPKAKTKAKNKENNYKVVKNIVYSNSYNILGLDITSTQKQITKRGKHILKYVAIGEVPDFNNDLYFIKEYRNETYIKEAIDNLSNPKNRLIDNFFWFDIENEEDKEVFKLINNKDYTGAISLLEKSDNRKNVAILYSLILLDKNIDNDSLSEPKIELVEHLIEMFDEIYKNEKFWKLFEKKFYLHDDLSTDKKILKEFKSSLGEYLSDLFYDISKNIGDENVIKLFNKYFNSTKGNKTNNEVGVFYGKLTKIADFFDGLGISEDGIFDDEEKKAVKDNINEMQEILNKIIGIGLYDSSKTLIIRDRMANSIRSITLDIYNNLDEKEKGLSFLKIAVNICGTEGLKSKLLEEMNTITKNIEIDKNDLVKLIIPLLLGDKELVFTSTQFIYNNEKYNYNDILEYSYYSIKNSFNGVTTGTTYRLKFLLSHKTVKIEFSSKLFNAGNDTKSELYARIVGMAAGLIEPLIIEKIKKNIFVDKNDYKIGDVTFTSEGYYIKKFFGGKKWVLWEETTYGTPTLEAGNVYLYNIEKGKMKHFSNINMDIPNAVILPKMIPEFLNYFNSNV